MYIVGIVMVFVRMNEQEVNSSQKLEDTPGPTSACRGVCATIRSIFEVCVSTQHISCSLQ